MSPSRHKEPAPRVGAYRLIQPLGRGGMAEVWTARDTRQASAPLVVVKRVLPHFLDEPAFVSMLRAEAVVMRRLDHPNIVRLRDFGDEGGAPFLVLDLVDGLELTRVADKLRARGPMPVGLAALVTRELARALAYVHALDDGEGRALGLIHRDVSPANVMLTFDGTVKLLDFGIAKALHAVGDEMKTRTGVLKGKLGYLSPEQIDGEELDARSDQFALGVVLHELCTGVRLFAAATAPLLLMQVRAARVAPPSLRNPEVPAALDRVCLRMLARERQARFTDCAGVVAELDPIVDELGWTPARLRELLQELELEPTISRAASATTPTPTPTMTPPPTPSPGRRLMVAALIAFVIGVVVAGWLMTRRAHTVVAPPPMSPQTSRPSTELAPPPLLPNAAPAPAPTEPAPPLPAETTLPAGKNSRAKIPPHAHQPNPPPSPAGDVVDPWSP